MGGAMAFRELTLTDEAALALEGSTLPRTNVAVPPLVRGWAAHFYRCVGGLNGLGELSNNLRVYALENDATPGVMLHDRVGVAPGRVTLNGTGVSLAAAAVATGIGSDGGYKVWAALNGASTAAVVVVSSAGGAWPGTPHFKLAEVTKFGGVITAITDARALDLFRK